MNINILFVDNDDKYLAKLKSSLIKNASDWTVSVSSEPEEALTLVAFKRIDVIVVDSEFKCPTENVFLDKVKQEKPNTIRLIMTNGKDERIIYRSSKAAHQYLLKSSSVQSMIETIEKTFYLRKYLRNEMLMKVISSIDKLPSLPETYLKIKEELAKDDFSMSVIAEIISKDVSITARVLQLVNSPFFGMTTKITNITQAVNLLGVERIMNFILFSEMFHFYKFPESAKIVLDFIWAHSLKVADRSRLVAKTFSNDKKLLEDCYIAGLLHDIGKIILLSTANYTSNVFAMILDETSFIKAEREFLGTTHAEVGAYLLGLWGLPEQIIMATCFHHKPSEEQFDSKFTPLSAVHIANTFVNSPKLDYKHIKSMNINLDLSSMEE